MAGSVCLSLLIGVMEKCEQPFCTSSAALPAPRLWINYSIHPPSRRNLNDLVCGCGWMNAPGENTTAFVIGQIIYSASGATVTGMTVSRIQIGKCIIIIVSRNKTIMIGVVVTVAVT